MNWKLKASIFRALSVLPFGASLHYRLQRHITKEWPRRTDVLDDLLFAAQRLLRDFHRHSAIDASQAQFIEIGAGRDLAIAVALRLMGVKSIVCVDITRLAKPDLIAHAARHIAARLGMPCPEITTWKDVEAFGIRYAAPTDLASMRLQSRSVDCFYSVDTLEHIPREHLASILSESARILKATGLGIHFIDYGDHYARGSSTSRFNFLQFSVDEWRRFNSDLQYVNRMRHSEFVDLFKDSGLAPIAIDPDVEEYQPAIIENLAPEFKQFSMSDLFTIRAKIVFGLAA